jgi:hypothetical protein
VQVGGTVRYEIYIAKGGEFWREGDGGYLNVSDILWTLGRVVSLLLSLIANAHIDSGHMPAVLPRLTTMGSTWSSVLDQSQTS